MYVFFFFDVSWICFGWLLCCFNFFVHPDALPFDVNRFPFLWGWPHCNRLTGSKRLLDTVFLSRVENLNNSSEFCSANLTHFIFLFNSVGVTEKPIPVCLRHTYESSLENFCTVRGFSHHSIQSFNSIHQELLRDSCSCDSPTAENGKRWDPSSANEVTSISVSLSVYVYAIFKKIAIDSESLRNT